MEDLSFRNIVDILKRREYGFYHAPHLSCAKIIRSLFYDKSNSFFDCCYQETSTKPIYVVENKLFFNNLTSCKAFHGSKKPVLKFETVFPYQKLVDFHTIHAVGLPFAPIPIEEYRNTFYILTQNSWLYIQDIETGQKVRAIYLIDDSVCKFRHVSFQNELDRIYIESMIHPRKSSAPNVIFSVIAFQILPLKLMGFVEFTSEIFGKDLKSIDFHNDVLITLHGSNTENYRAFVYDFDAILCDENKLFDIHLGEYCQQLSGIVGEFPFGIPVNYHIKKLPPVLFRVGCTSDSIDFSPLPKVYILTSPKKSGLFEVRDVFTHELIGTVGGAKDLMEKYYDLEDDDIFTDIRDRVVYKNQEQISVYNIDQIEDEQKMARSRKKLTLNFVIKLPTDENEKIEAKNSNQNSDERRVMPQRTAKRNKQFAYAEWQKNKVISMHYNNVLELFLVLADIPNFANSATVLLYDAVSGQLMVQFHTPFHLKDENMYNVHMFYEMIFIVERNMRDLKYKVYAFQLSRNAEDNIDVES